MTERYTGYKSTTGKVFDDEHSAWRDDLTAWLSEGGITSVAIANQIGGAIKFDTVVDLHQIITGLKKTMPAPPQELNNDKA